MAKKWLFEVLLLKNLPLVQSNARFPPDNKTSLLCVGRNLCMCDNIANMGFKLTGWYKMTANYSL